MRIAVASDGRLIELLRLGQVERELTHELVEVHEQIAALATVLLPPACLRVEEWGFQAWSRFQNASRPVVVNDRIEIMTSDGRSRLGCVLLDQKPAGHVETLQGCHGMDLGSEAFMPSRTIWWPCRGSHLRRTRVELLYRCRRGVRPRTDSLGHRDGTSHHQVDVNVRLTTAHRRTRLQPRGRNTPAHAVRRRQQESVSLVAPRCLHGLVADHPFARSRNIDRPVDGRLMRA